MKSRIIFIYFGLSFVILGILELLEFVDITPLALLGYAVSAVLFALAFFVEKVYSGTVYGKMGGVVLFLLRLSAVFSIIIFPLVNIRSEYVSKLAFSFILFTFGIVFVLISNDETMMILLGKMKKMSKIAADQEVRQNNSSSVLVSRLRNDSVKRTILSQNDKVKAAMTIKTESEIKEKAPQVVNQDSENNSTDDPQIDKKDNGFRKWGSY